MQIKRTNKLKDIIKAFDYSSAVAILGPRQCGKTTLAHQFAKYSGAKKVHFFDMEDPNDLAALENPILTLESLQGLIVIDEIQRRADLFPALRVLIDRFQDKQYLILGSASQELLKQSSETLAGRISYLELSGFGLNELDINDFKKRWVRGGFPRSFLAKSYQSAFDWRQNFITTFFERDIPNMGINIPSRAMRRFWMMLAHYHGNVFNASQIGKSLAISNMTASRYLDLLSGTFLVRQLQPWFYNTKKRIIKRPKIYFRDSGIFHALLGIVNIEELFKHPQLGASWEGFVIEQVVNVLRLREEEMFFWGVHTGAECDLVISRKGKLWGVEIKYQDSPHLTPSMCSAISELSLEYLWVIYPGKKKYSLNKKVTALPITDILKISI